MPAKKDPNAPKKALSAYMLWLGEHRAQYTVVGKPATETVKKAAEAWRNLEDKSEWEKKAAEDKKRYERDMAAFEKK